jgi:flagellin
VSNEQIQANQLQVDSSLEAIDRIAKTTTFQGRKLLDGSLDFTTTSVADVVTAATAQIGSNHGAFANVLVSAAGANNDFVITALSANAVGNSYSVQFTTGGPAAGAVVSVDTTNKAIQINISAANTAEAIVSVLNATSAFTALFSASLATGNDGTGTIDAAAANRPQVVQFSGGRATDIISLTAVTAGTGPNSYTISLINGGTGTHSATLSGNNFQVTFTANSNINTIKDLISASGLFTATISGTEYGGISAGTTIASQVTGGTNNGAKLQDLRIDQANFGSQSSIAVEVQIDAQATQGQLTYSGGSLTSDLVLEVGGLSGFEVFNFGSGNTITQIRDAVNLVTDATGVSASISGSDLVFKSSEFGTKAFVSVRSLNTTTFAAYDTGNSLTTRDAGSDIRARINGVAATGDGLVASINTSTLDLSFKANSYLSAGSTASFTITGGGANFQLGPDVVSNQQARLGIQGVNTATLGGTSGQLYQLRTGGTKALSIDTKGAAAVVDQVISKVTSLRGRLGAFQKTTLETNIFTLTDTLTALTDAQSSIRDADFARETANLTRSQILVQSGTSVLTIANQNPQQVLALLR